MKDEIATLIDQANAVTDSVERNFGLLDAEQLNWRPSEKSWSIAQCLDHLIVTNRLEFPAIENALRPNYRNPFWSKVPLLPDIFGKTAIYLFKPQGRLKLKAPKSFQPSQSRLSEKIVQQFIAHQKELIKMLARCGDLDLRKTRIVSPVSDLITYRLKDAFQILLVHEQRHLQQAVRVLAIQIG